MGSLRESVLVLYVVMKERVEHAKIRAVMQGIVDKEKGPEVFEEYMKLAFPWIETAKGREQLNHMAQLAKEVSRGPIKVTPMGGMDRRVRSRMKERIEAPPVKQKATPRDLNKLYEKLRDASSRR